MNSIIFKPRNAILILLIFSLGLYYHTMNAELLSVDDVGLMYDYNNKNFNFNNFFFPDRMDVYYRPVVLSSFLIDYFIWGDHESGFHLTNMIFHSANVILVYILCLLMLDKIMDSRNPRILQPPFIPFFAALFFAIHPVNTEAVNFISGRTDILATFFALISFLSFFLYKQSTVSHQPSTFKYLFLSSSLLSYMLAILSKEVALTLPLIIAAYEYFLNSSQTSASNQGQVRLLNLQSSIKEKMKQPFLGLIIFSFPTVIYFYLRSVGLSGGDIGVGKTLSILDISSGMFFNFTISAGFYFKKLLYPFPLNLTIIQINKELYFIIGAILMVFLLFQLLNSSTLQLLSFLLWSIFFSLLPSIAISLAPMAWTPYAERYLYLPSVFFCILFSIVIARLLNATEAIFNRLGLLRLRLAMTLPVVIMLAITIWFSVATYKRNILWFSNLTIWEDTIKKSPNFGKIYNEYGLALMKSGNEEKAKEQFLKGIEFGDKQKPLFNLGLLAIKNNNLDLAERHLTEGIKISPDAWAYRKLASIYLEKAGKDNKEYLLKAIENYKKAYKLDRGNEFLALKLGGLYYRAGKYEDAMAILRKAIDDNPNSYIEKPAKKILGKINKRISSSETSSLSE